MNLQRGFSRVRDVIGGIVKDQKMKGNVETASLVASAPDMFLELKYLKKWFDKHSGPGLGNGKPNTENLEHLIAKVEGK